VHGRAGGEEGFTRDLRGKGRRCGNFKALPYGESEGVPCRKKKEELGNENGIYRRECLSNRGSGTTPCFDEKRGLTNIEGGD